MNAPIDPETKALLLDLRAIEDNAEWIAKKCCEAEIFLLSGDLAEARLAILHAERYVEAVREGYAEVARSGVIKERA